MKFNLGPAYNKALVMDYREAFESVLPFCLIRKQISKSDLKKSMSH